jgi:hypothetical protein
LARSDDADLHICSLMDIVICLPDIKASAGPEPVRIIAQHLLRD